jgi:peptidoglycan hydrolase-like protein with peptidoglycan-binding domain
MSMLDPARGAPLRGRAEPVQQHGEPAAAAPAGPFAGNPEFQAVAEGRCELSIGARGDAVRTLQAALAALGAMPAGAQSDGIFGRVTEGALAGWQRANGLGASGRLDASTLAKLGEAAARAPGADDAAEVARLLDAGKGLAALEAAMGTTGELIDNAMGGRWAVREDADPADVARFRGFLAALGEKLTALARAAEKDRAAQPETYEDGIPRRIPAAQLAALIDAFGTADERRRWNAGAPRTPAAPHQP